MATTLTLIARGHPATVLDETRQVLATARLCVEDRLAAYGDDDARTLGRTAETLRKWEEQAQGRRGRGDLVSGDRMGKPG